MGVEGELEKLMVKTFRTAAIVLLSALGIMGLGLASGLRWNGSDSLPVGLYFATWKPAHKGDLVFVKLPASVFALAAERGYLSVAYSPTPHILKRLVGIAGDRVTIDSDGVEVNGIHLTNSTPLPSDRAGRPLHAYLLTDYILGPNEVLLMSDYNPASFDGRYFGPLKIEAIESVVRPLLTF